MASFFQDSLALAIQTRKNYLSLIDSQSLAELNTIPLGFNNNIIWNIAHIVATMDILFYSLSGLTPKLEASFIDQYRKGTKPSEMVDLNMVNQLKETLLSQLDRIKNDVESGLFPENLPKPYTTSYHFELRTFEDLVRFNQVHEALHMGMVLGLRKFV